MRRGLIVLAMLLWVVPAWADTHTAADCSQAAVNTALAAAHDGDIVAIPAGSCTWTSGISMSLTKSLTIQGAGAISATTGGGSTTGTDQTTILDHLPAAGHNLLALTVGSGKALRLTGIAFTQDGSSVVTQDGVIKVTGETNSLRIDHCHFVINADSTMTIHTAGGSEPLTGVIDHNYFDSAVGYGPFAVYLQNGAGYGDAAWAAADSFGSSSFLYIEDNRWRNGMLGDANGGGQRFVYRYNTMVMESYEADLIGYVANHGTTNSRWRGTRATEFYGNVVTVPSLGLNKGPFGANSGSTLIWGNTITQYRYVAGLGYTRQDNSTYDYGSPPSGWGNCTGTSGTVWDGTGGYPCMDAPGRGAGDLLSGEPIASTVNTRTNTQAWVQQALSPVYVWSNTFTPASGYDVLAAVQNLTTAALVQANREYYSWEGASCSGESCATGVGSGLRSARPTNCTTGVGYWATDETTLYVCSATNTWSTYYTPYTYPQPLTVAPAAPTAAAIINASGPKLQWTHATGTGVTWFQVVDGATTTNLGLPTPTGTTYVSATFPTLTDGAHTLVIQACNVTGCTAATAITVVKL